MDSVEKVQQIVKQLEPLLGAKVIGVQALPYRGEIYPRLILKTPEGKILIVEAQTPHKYGGILAIFEREEKFI